METIELGKANRLRTSSLNNQLVNNYWTEVFQAKANGKLVCWYEGVAINPLMQAADIMWVHGEAWSALLAARNNEAVAQNAAEERGYLKELCSYARTHIGCGVLSQRKGAEASGTSFSDALGAGRLAECIPEPDMFISAYPYCSTGQQWDEMLYRLFGKRIPIFNISVPWIWGNKADSAYLAGTEFKEATQYMVKQIKECIKFIELQTKKKYDFEKLCEIMSYTKQAGKLRMDTMALCSAKPAPASFFDWTTNLAPVNFLPGGSHIVDYFQQVQNEIKERIVNKEGAVTKEKYRLFWDGIMNWNKIGWLANKFASYDATMVAGRYTHMGFWHEHECIDINNPLEGMAINYLVCPINLSAPLMIEQIIKLCKQYEIDGVVLHAARTCRAFSNPQFLISEAIQKKLGLPVIMFEGDMVDESFYKDEIVSSRIEAMIENIHVKESIQLY